MKTALYNWTMNWIISLLHQDMFEMGNPPRSREHLYNWLDRTGEVWLKRLESKEQS